MQGGNKVNICTKEYMGKKGGLYMYSQQTPDPTKSVRMESRWSPGCHTASTCQGRERNVNLETRAKVVQNGEMECRVQGVKWVQLMGRKESGPRQCEEPSSDRDSKEKGRTPRQRWAREIG